MKKVLINPITVKKHSLCLKGRKCKGACINSNLNCAVTVSYSRSRDLDALISLINGGGQDFDDNFYIAEGKRVTEGEKFTANLNDKFVRNDQYSQLWYEYDGNDDYAPYVDILRLLGSNAGNISTGEQLWNDKDEDAYIYSARIASKILNIREFNLETSYDPSLNTPPEIAMKVYGDMGGESFKYFCSPAKMSELFGSDPDLFYLTLGKALLR